MSNNNEVKEAKVKSEEVVDYCPFCGAAFEESESTYTNVKCAACQEILNVRKG